MSDSGEVSAVNESPLHDRRGKKRNAIEALSESLTDFRHALKSQKISQKNADNQSKKTELLRCYAPKTSFFFSLFFFFLLF